MISDFRGGKNSKADLMSEVKPVSNIPLSESKRKRRKIRKEFALGTSCHGLSQIYSSFSNVLRFLWILLILTVFAFLIWQVGYASDFISKFKSIKSTLGQEFVKF